LTTRLCGASHALRALANSQRSVATAISRLGTNAAGSRFQPAFAREAREGCRAEAQQAKAGYSARELRLGKQKYRKQPHAQ
jgi:hypothetical protein